MEMNPHFWKFLWEPIADTKGPKKIRVDTTGIVYVWLIHSHSASFMHNEAKTPVTN